MSKLKAQIEATDAGAYLFEPSAESIYAVDVADRTRPFSEARVASRKCHIASQIGQS
jgi:hypothetical protein